MTFNVSPAAAAGELVRYATEVFPLAAIDPEAVKRDSEAIIRRTGGEICDWLPFLDRDAKPREVEAVVRRALILNAMLQIYFKAPALSSRIGSLEIALSMIFRKRSERFWTRKMKT